MSFPLRALKNLGVVNRSWKVQVSMVTCVREMKVWVRPVINKFQQRREAEEFRSVYPIKPTPRSEYTDWNYNAELYAFGKRLGEEFNDSLLRQALTDRSYVTIQLQRQEELGLKLDESNLKDNEYLATEGANILRGIALEILSKEFPKLPEEGLQAVYNYLTTESALASISSLIGTKDLILSDDYPPTEPVLAKALLALIAALDKSSGVERTEKFIIDLVLTQLVGKDIFELWDIPLPWSMLTEILRRQGQEAPEPRIISQVGPATILAAYVVGLYNAEKKLIGKGIGETLEIAQEMAARDTLREIFGLKKSKNGFDFLAPPRPNLLPKEKAKLLT